MTKKSHKVIYKICVLRVGGLALPDHIHSIASDSSDYLNLTKATGVFDLVIIFKVKWNSTVNELTL